WTFAYPTLGPRLLTGWLALAPLSGALAPKPTLAVSGDDRAGRGRLLAFCKAALGHWAALVPDATAAALEEAGGFDSLASIMDAVPGTAMVRPPIRRRPLWAADMPPGASARMRLVRAEAAQVLGLEDGVIDLALRGIAAGCDEKRLFAEARAIGGWFTS